MEGGWAALVAQSQQLTTGLRDTADHDYLIQRSAEQIDETSRRLVAKTSSRTEGGESDAAKNKGRYLLATKGFDAEKLVQNLNAISLKKTFEPLQPLAETDLEGYLKTEHDNMVLTALQEAKKETVDQFWDALSASMLQDWHAVRLQVLGAVSHRHPQSGARALPVRAHDVAKRPVIATTYKITEEQLRYLRVVQKVHDVLANETGPFPVARSFAAVERGGHRELQGPWRLIEVLVEEDRSPVRAGMYREKYINRTQDLDFQFIRNVKQVFEKQYEDWIRTSVQQNSVQAMIGGEHNTLNQVLGFCATQPRCDAGKNPSLVDKFQNKAPWPIIFYCLRSGHPVDALNFISQSGAEAHLQPFPSMLRKYVNDRPTVPDASTRSKCLDIMRSTTDPFKKAAYNVVSRIEPQQNWSSEILETIEDWLWLKLAMIDMINAGESTYSLNQLRNSQGQLHRLSDINRFLVLLALQQFEAAVNFLYTTERYRTAAVHFAIALNYYGLIRPPFDNLTTVLFESGPTGDVLNYEVLLQNYVFNQNAWGGPEALPYLCLIPTENVKIKALADLILSSQNVQLFVGTIVPRRKGLLYQFVNEATATAVAELAAAQSQSQGRYVDAITLYDLVNKQAAAINVLNSRLSLQLAKSGEERDALMALAHDLAVRYATTSGEMRISQGDYLEFHRLYRLAHFFDLYHTNRYEDALQHLKEVGVPPLDSGVTVESWSRLGEAVKRNMGEILLAAMVTLHALYQNTRQQMADAQTEKKKMIYRHMARSVVQYAGNIPWRSPDLNALIRYEMAMT